METHPPEHLLVHPLPPAPYFVGREAELQELRDFWQTGLRGVLALVGLGGAGKTAVAARFLDELAGAGADRPAGLFLWSFYQEPDAGLFLQRAYNYFGGPAAAAQPAKGPGLLHLLQDALAQGGPHWLVLDGLERVQRQESDAAAAYGQLEDPLLKSLQTRAAEGMGQTVVLVTSRFPVTDLWQQLGKGYRHLDVGGLEPQAARALLRQHGVIGDDAGLDSLIARYGAHALTLDHLGGILGQFLGGDPQRAPEVAELADPGKDRQALRLSRLLRAYEDHLPPEELTLLCRLCVLRRSVSEKQVFKFFLCSPSLPGRVAREVADLVKRFPGLDEHLTEAESDELSESLCEAMLEAMMAKHVAGPEEAFRQEFLAIAEKLLGLRATASDINFGELARLYSDHAQENPTDLRPLGSEDRKAFVSLYARYGLLREHAQMPFKEPPAALELAFKQLGFGKKHRPPIPEELDPADVWEGAQRVKRRLGFLAGKHHALLWVRELIRNSQRKWSLAGPLAVLDEADLRQVLQSLEGRHLILREADGSFSVHPAVRDHFQRLAAAQSQGAWHDLLREQLVSLVQRPGQRHPSDPAGLDLAEEAIYHALQSGRTDEALWLYEQVPGGLRQLAWKLGESSRGLRILRGFNPCPDPWAMAWYLRALGEFEQAFACNELPYFRADIRLLQGRLPEVAALGDSTRTPIADFLMGRSTTLPPEQLGAAIPREQLLLYLCRPERVRGATVLDAFYHHIGWEGHRARCQLLLAEAARRQADEDLCRQYLEAASVWILHSGSVEHLCLLHQVRARAPGPVAGPDASRRAVVEGLRTARHFGLGLFEIELLCDYAELLLIGGNVPAAEEAAREALRRASDSACQFLWGAAQAGHLVGQALSMQQRFGQAREFLEKTLLLRRQIGDPRAAATENLLAIVPR
jgi:hypothetical protein